MGKIIEFYPKTKNQINIIFPLLELDNIPKNYTFKEIMYKEDEINKFHSIYWYRLIRKIYQEPMEIECELIEKNQEESQEIIYLT